MLLSRLSLSHPEVVHEEGGPSHQHDIPITRHVSSSPLVTYQKGLRALFAAARRVLSPHQVEGASLSSPAQAAQRGKQPMIDEGPSGVPDTEVIDFEASSPSREAKEII